MPKGDHEHVPKPDTGNHFPAIAGATSSNGIGRTAASPLSSSISSPKVTPKKPSPPSRSLNGLTLPSLFTQSSVVGSKSSILPRSPGKAVTSTSISPKRGNHHLPSNIIFSPGNPEPIARLDSEDLPRSAISVRSTPPASTSAEGPASLASLPPQEVTGIQDPDRELVAQSASLPLILVSSSPDPIAPLGNLLSDQAEIRLGPAPELSVAAPKSEGTPTDLISHGRRTGQLKTNPSTLEGVAAMLNAGFHLNDHPESLFSILKGPFEANWFKMKECLTMGQWPGIDLVPKHDQSLLLMHKMVGMRKLKWKEFTVLVLMKMKEEVKRIASMKGMESSKEALERESEQQNLAMTLDSVGAEAVTSDIDLSLAGTNTEIAVKLINTEFPKHFLVPYAPATVFDINVYASDWIHNLKNTETYTDDRVAHPDGRNILTITPGVEHTRVSAPGLLKIDTEQEIWSMVKIRRNLNEDQWTAYKLGLSAELLPAQRILMGTKFSKVEFQYKRFTLDIHLRKRKLSEEFNFEETKIKGSETMFNAKYSSDALETIASNDIYGDLLLNVKKLRLELQGPDRPDDPAHRIKMENKAVLLSSRIAEALTFANEVYSTEGAVKHTVLGQGAGKKLVKLNESRASNPLKLVYNFHPELYLQSVNENVGDALHSLHAYHHAPPYAVYRAGKYLARLVEAAHKVISEPQLSGIEGFTRIKLIGATSIALKSKKVIIKGTELEGDPGNVMRNGFFRAQGGSIDSLTSTIISVGAAIAGKYHNKSVPASMPAVPSTPAVRRSPPE